MHRHGFEYMDCFYHSLIRPKNLTGILLVAKFIHFDKHRNLVGWHKDRPSDQGNGFSTQRPRIPLARRNLDSRANLKSENRTAMKLFSIKITHLRHN